MSYTDESKNAGLNVGGFLILLDLTVVVSMVLFLSIAFQGIPRVIGHCMCYRAILVPSRPCWLLDFRMAKFTVEFETKNPNKHQKYRKKTKSLSKFKIWDSVQMVVIG